MIQEREPGRELFVDWMLKLTRQGASSFPTTLFMKILYLATMNITAKSTMPIRNWGSILDHLMIYFGDRVEINI